MCGIAGIYQIHGVMPSDDFVRMIDSLTHRGPDGRGIYKSRDEKLFLGHRRLNILDLSDRGTQPMSDASGRYWITFNGEIYNFLELRTELRNLGHSFSSDSDTEVILAAYAEWGIECQLKLNGMWAFAIWDNVEQSLFLSRDRFGVKPLLYLFDRDRFAFASELKAFLCVPDFEADFDPKMVASCLRDTSILEPTSQTLIKGINRLKAGHCLRFSAKKGIQISKWWNTLDHLVPVPMNFDEQVIQFKEIFQSACKIRMRSDVPIGNALSGGLDSSSVLATMSNLRKSINMNSERILEKQLRAFVALYPHTSQDEFPFAKQMIEATKVDSSYVEVDSGGFVDHFDECLYQHEDIFELPIGPWTLYRKFRQENTVISLDGHGGDEILGGYHHQVEANLYHALCPFPNFSHFNELRNILSNLYSPNYPLPKPSLSTTLLRALVHRLRPYPRFQFALQNLYRKGKQLVRGNRAFEWIHLPIENSVFDEIEQFSRENSLKGLNRILYEDFHLRTLPMILRNFDRASMAHGVEVRAPFLDWRLVCFCFSLPARSKIGGHWTKRILREAMKGTLPESIRLRASKMGFTNPLIEWIGKPFRTFILDSVSSRDFLESPIWNGPEISQYVQRCYQNGDLTGVRRAWEYIQANHLMRLFKVNKMASR
ncbi:MAG TPA: asparagine synthase (glutamine-hydrolyzing) [Chlamydiales bacterium]|nr:asparagine synthase (glutamine-hydrolyzing) [Chlamydiales bacterium]